MSNKTIQSKIDELSSLFVWLRDHLEKASFQPSNIRKIELALEEAVVNVITHAYKNREGKIEVSLSIFEKDRIEIQIKDWGPEFNPLVQNTQIQADLPLEDREVGGLGIFLMRQYMDKVDYQRIDSTNVLVLTKKI